jgi:WD40 repeat protein
MTLRSASLLLVALYTAAPLQAEPPRLDRNGTPLPTGAIVRLGDARFLHGKELHSLQYTPDGKFLLGGDRNRMCLWDVKTGQEVREFTGLESPDLSARCAVLSPNGKILAGGGLYDHKVWFWETATGRVSRKLGGGNGSPLAVWWTRDGKRVAASLGSVLLLWDAETGKELIRIIDPTSTKELTHFAMSPDGTRFVSGDYREGTLRLWDATTGKELKQMEGCPRWWGGLVFSPDGKCIIGSWSNDKRGSGGHYLRVWDATTGKDLQDLHRGAFTTPAFSPDGKEMAVGYDELISVWDWANRKQLRKWKVDSKLGVLTYSPDGKTIAADTGGRIRFFDAETGKEQTPPGGHTSPVRAVAFSPRGDVIVSSSYGELRTWDWRTSRQLRADEIPSDASISSLAYSPDGKELVSWRYHRSAKVYYENGLFALSDGVTGHSLGEFPSEPLVNAIAFHPDGKRFLAAGSDHTIGVWDPRGGKQLKQIDPWPKNANVEWRWGIEDLSISPDGQHVAWTDTDRAGILDLETGQNLVELKVGDSAIHRIAFSPDNSCVATHRNQWALQLWHPVTGKQVAEWTEAGGDVIAFSPDGRFIAIGGYRDVVIWDVAVRAEVMRFAGHRAAVNALAFEPRGRVLVSASADGTLLVWDLTSRLKDGKLPPEELTETEMKAHWVALAGKDPLRAQKSVVALASAGTRAVEFIEQRLRAVPKMTRAGLEKMVDQLGDDDFQSREEATRILSALGEVAEPFLRAAVNSANPEIRRRATALARALGRWELTPEQTQIVRAVAALEYAGVVAKPLLTRLAEGDPNARITRQAKGVLTRLERSTKN